MKKYTSLTKKEKLKSKVNPYDFEMHYLSMRDWLSQSFQIVKDDKGNEIRHKDGTVTDENGNTHQLFKYDIKRKAEVWMICLTALINLEFKVRSESIAKGQEPKQFVFYGRYTLIRNLVLNMCPSELRHQLSKSFTVPAISTAMKRMETSGLISIKYNHDVKYRNRKDGEYFRAITINHDKLVELSDFSLDREERRESATWKKYSRCSREHRWMRKRVISSFKAIDEQLTTKEKKAQIKAKMAKFKVEYKCKQDLFKVFINRMQAHLYSPNSNAKQYMTTIKSKEDQSDDLVKNMYVHPDTGEIVLSKEQYEVLQSFYENIK